jgi:hypothetical protein
MREFDAFLPSAFTILGKGTVQDWYVASAKVVIISSCLIASTLEKASGKWFQKAGAKHYGQRNAFARREPLCHEMRTVAER